MEDVPAGYLLYQELPCFHQDNAFAVRKVVGEREACYRRNRLKHLNGFGKGLRGVTEG